MIPISIPTIRRANFFNEFLPSEIDNNFVTNVVTNVVTNIATK